MALCVFIALTNYFSSRFYFILSTMAQNAYSPIQHGGVSNGQPGQQDQGHYVHQLALGVPQPQDFCPLNVSTIIMTVLDYTIFDFES